MITQKPVGLPPQVWDALREVQAAQECLEDRYPTSNKAGKDHHVAVAAIALREAHTRIMHYATEIEDSF